jgi:hypothetical protein
MRRSRRALSFDWAGMARIGPITVKFLAVLLLDPLSQ